MKKYAILALSVLLVAATFAGCRRNVGNETSNPTGTTPTVTQPATTHPTTRPTTLPTETTRQTEPSHDTTPGSTPTDMIPGGDHTDSTGHSRIMPPRY